MTDLVQMSYLRWLAGEDQAEAKWTTTLRNYYDGKHPTYLTDRQKEFIGLWSQDKKYIFSDNYAALVVDIPAERLEVTGFTADDEAQAAQAELGWQWWQDNYFDSKQDDLFEASLKDGESYLVVSFDAGRPQWDVNYKYALDEGGNGYGVKLHRHPDTQQPLFASKRWVDYDPTVPGSKPVKRLTLYFPDRIEKYRLPNEFDNRAWREAGWAPVPEADGAWPIDWRDATGAPLGLPIIPFTNPGGPEINRIYPLQDALNKTLLDVIASADFHGFPIITASGVGANEDIKVGPNRMLRSQNPTANFNRLAGENPEGLLDTCSMLVQEIAGKARIPQYLFQRWGAEPPSGESLKSQEVGLLSKIGRKHKDFGASFRQVIELSARVDRHFNPVSQADPTARIKPQWKRAEVRSLEDMEKEADAKRKAGVPEERILVEVWGYTPDEARQFAQQAKARRDEVVGKTVVSLLQGQQQEAGDGAQD